jgi:hypothetical protein
MHDSPKWYNTPKGQICKKTYLKQYHEKNKEDVNEARKKKYQEDVEYRNAVNERNKEADKKRRSEGYVRKRKPRSEWTEEEKQKAKEAKQRYNNKNVEKIREDNKKYHAEHYKNNEAAYKETNKLSRTYVENQFSYLKSNAKRRNAQVLLTLEEYKLKRSQPCHYCGRELEETGTCLDRLDNNTRAYDNENSVPCCHICNYLKGVYLTEEETFFAVLALKKYHLYKVIPDKIEFSLNPTVPKLTPSEKFTHFVATNRIRGIEISIERKDFEVLLKTSCFYCGGIPSGLDRLDNKIDYHFDNCVPCCPVCNKIKADIFSFEEMLAIANAIQKIRIFNTQNCEKVCAVCGVHESTKWIKNPDSDTYLCGEHYKKEFDGKNAYYNGLLDIEEIYKNYYDSVLNRTKTPRPKKKMPDGSWKTYDSYKQIIESRHMVLISTFEEYINPRKHKELVITCSKGHLFKRTCERIRQFPNCPACEGLSNKFDAFKERLSSNGWVYVSGEYQNKDSKLIAICEHGKTHTRQYRWFRDNTCACVTQSPPLRTSLTTQLEFQL